MEFINFVIRNGNRCILFFISLTCLSFLFFSLLGYQKLARYVLTCMLRSLFWGVASIFLTFFLPVYIFNMGQGAIILLIVCPFIGIITAVCLLVSSFIRLVVRRKEFSIRSKQSSPLILIPIVLAFIAISLMFLPNDILLEVTIAFFCVAGFFLLIVVYAWESKTGQIKGISKLMVGSDFIYIEEDSTSPLHLIEGVDARGAKVEDLTVKIEESFVLSDKKHIKNYRLLKIDKGCAFIEEAYENNLTDLPNNAKERQDINTLRVYSYEMKKSN